MEPLDKTLNSLLAGLSATEVDPQIEESEPPCLLCGGAGVVTLDVRVGHPDFGKVFPCDCRADEIAQRERERLEGLSNLGALRRLTFEALAQGGRHAEAEH